MTKLLTELIQVALGNREVLSNNPSDKEWELLFDISVKQAVSGFVFDALDALANQGQKLPPSIFFNWIGLSEQIKQQNTLLNKRCKDITTFFTEAGYKSCILKGQSNARMYPNALSRTPGDIDIWVYGKTDNEKITIGRLSSEIIALVRNQIPEAFEQSYHIEFPIYDDVMIEVHYLPNILFNPKSDKKFREWFLSQEDTAIVFCEECGYSVPTNSFNAVYQMAHLFTHFFTEGVGLRHFIDYYYVLKNISPSNFSEIKKTLNRLGMKKFARGVMWIEQYYLGISENHLLYEPLEKIGRLILREMEEGGNFGQYDKRYTARKNGLIARGMADTWRLVSLARFFPSECSWKALEKITNQKWKIRHWILRGWRKS